MNQFSELKMSVDATFSSILNEIQLSGLNFKIQVTPYAQRGQYEGTQGQKIPQETQ